MVFFLLIILPFLVPIAFFTDLRLLFSMPEQWIWLSAIVVALDFAYFFLLYLRNKDKFKQLLAFFLHSVFFIALGFAFALVSAEQLAINLVSVFWPLMLLIFLFSIFHFAYGTQKLSLIETKNILPYVNVAGFFLLGSVLIYLNIFLAVPWWIIFPVFFAGAFVFNLSFFMLFENSFKAGIFLASIISIIIFEIMLALFYLPAGFYVLGALLAIFYYVMIILFKKKLEGGLYVKDYVKNFAFASALALIIITTSHWL